MRPCASATTGSSGPFELIDQAGREESWPRRARGPWALPVPPPSRRKLLEAGGFYAVEDARQARSAGVLAGGRVPVSSRSGRAPPLRHQARRVLADRARMARPRCGTWATVSLRARDPYQAQYHRHRRAEARPGSSIAHVIDGRQRQGLPDLQRGQQLLRRRQSRPGTLRRQYRHLATRSSRWSPAGQKAFRALRYAPFPVVAAPAGLALGGGCEICLAADAVVAHAETYMGLVETGVGIVPAWGGCAPRCSPASLRDPKRPKGPRGRHCAGVQDDRPRHRRQIGHGSQGARLPPRLTDEIVMHRDHLLARMPRHVRSPWPIGTSWASRPHIRLAGRSGPGRASTWPSTIST